MKKKSLPLSKVYQLIEPGPVVMVSTAEAKKANIMTMSWHMMIDFVPPLIALVMSEDEAWEIEQPCPVSLMSTTTSSSTSR